MLLTAPERRRQLIVLIAALTALSPLTTDLYLPAFPAMGHDLHTGQAAIQLTLTAYLVGTALGQLVAGPLSDAHGRIAPLRLALGLYVVVTVVSALSPNVGVLIGLRVAQGVIASTSIVVVRAVVRDLFEGVEVARFLSRLMTITGLVPILAPFFGGQLLRLTDWRGIFVLLAVIGAVELVAMSRWLPETNPLHTPADRRLAGCPRGVRHARPRPGLPRRRPHHVVRVRRPAGLHLGRVVRLRARVRAVGADLRPDLRVSTRCSW